MEQPIYYSCVNILMVCNNTHNSNTHPSHHILFITYKHKLALFQPNKLSQLITGYMISLQIELNITIPTEISILIQKFYSINNIESFKINEIPARSGHGGCLIKSNNKLGFFVFGGSDRTIYYLDGTYIIWL